MATNPTRDDLEDHCGCQKPKGHRGSSGWHFRPVTKPDVPSEMSSKPYLHQEIAYERCPGYWFKIGRQIDPDDRTRLVDTTRRDKSRDRKGRRDIAD